MARMFTPDPLLQVETEGEKQVEEKLAVVEESGEFEYVLGRRQVASVSLVLLTGLAAFTAMAYMVGKSSAAPAKEKTVVVQAPAPAPKPVTAAAVVTAEAPKIEASILDAPLSGTPEKGRLYIQLASVERGFATLMVHGARKLGFPAFVATGASPSVYRVLSGPFADKESYEKAKAMFQAAGLDTFTRKYTGEDESKSVMPKPDESVQP
jgi:cell division septation protein DedD